MKTILFLSILWLGVIWTAEGQVALRLDQYNGDLQISSTGSITFTDGFHVPQGGTMRAFIADFPVDIRPNPVFNYITTYSVRKPGIVNPTVSSLGVESVMVDVQYFDELGRLAQEITAKGSPSLQDVVQPHFYDLAGRKVVNPLPYVDIFARPYSIHGEMHYFAATTYHLFYLSNYLLPGITGTTKPNTQRRFENSPLERLLEEGPPGESGQISSTSAQSGHTRRIGYQGNGAGIAKYTVTINATTGERSLARTGNNAVYANSELAVVTVKDENWVSSYQNAGTTQTFTDKNGRVVLKRQYNRNGSNVEVLSTYYVYDDFGNLCFVLPPSVNPDQNTAITQTAIDNLCYQYRYDGRQRLIEKRLPGKGWEYYIYNKLDRMIMTQDAVQRSKAPQQWTVIKYDHLGRTVVTGIFNHSGTTANSNYRSDLQGQADQVSPQWENRIATGNGYSSVAFPTSLATVLTIQYYDDYNFPGGNPYAYSAGSKQTRGLLTGKKVGVLGTSNMLWNVYYYDQEGRVIKEFKQHYKGGSLVAANVDEISNSYNFTDDLLSTRRIHKVNGSQSLDYLTEYNYDHRSRLTDVWHQINGQSKTHVSNLEYNELGQLWKKRLHYVDAYTPLQKLTFDYHIRGWIKNLTAPKLSYSLFYEDGSTPRYNGDISKFTYSSEKVGSRDFTYTYDDVNRLKTSVYSSNGELNESIDYDKAGNILSVIRGGAGNGTLSYTYQNSGLSNRLASISGYKSGSYSYDGNGNMLTDGVRGLALTYNMLNLPASISGAHTGSYTYDADGRKLRSVINGTAREYIDGIYYEGSAIKFVSTSEGRAINDNGTYKYQYNLADHLGNIRVTFDVHNGNARVIQEDEYYAYGLNKLKYSFGGDENRYLYNGKELQTGIGYYDYGARFYDPEIGRWNVVDPLAEKMPSWSPYSYTFNNPINFIDPDGRIPYPITVRSFAPFRTFGYGFHGDNRGYTTSSATARVHQVINFDTDKTKITARAWSSPTSHRLLPGSRTATPSVEFTGNGQVRTSGDAKTFTFGTHSKGGNPMTPKAITPNIDVFSDFSITENKKAGTLDISGTLTGDNFPSTEAFISDPSGQNVFLGIGQIGAGVDKDSGPMDELPGENRDRPITNFNFSITTDKKGNFTGVRMGDTRYSIEDWNKRFTSQPTQQQ